MVVKRNLNCVILMENRINLEMNNNGVMVWNKAKWTLKAFLNVLIFIHKNNQIKR